MRSILAEVPLDEKKFRKMNVSVFLEAFRTQSYKNSTFIHGIICIEHFFCSFTKQISRSSSWHEYAIFIVICVLKFKFEAHGFFLLSLHIYRNQFSYIWVICMKNIWVIEIKWREEKKNWIGTVNLTKRIKFIREFPSGGENPKYRLFFCWPMKFRYLDDFYVTFFFAFK